MGSTKGNKNENNFTGVTNFNGPVQFAAGDINNGNLATEKNTAKYTPKPMWRSPFTLAILSWVSVIIGILGLFPVTWLIRNALNIFKGNFQLESNSSTQIDSIVFAVLVILFVLFFSLRRIAKKQIRIPLIFNYAINGYGKRITIEKINIDECPQCGGKMRYYNKPVEWIDTHYSDGRTKREVTKRIPVLECKRNHEHCYSVDPAEDKVK
ncbi:MAG: hypothetical protein PHO10_08660 [Gemmiger sp.]|nr:hypothetical protein [Gemmiger sp.]